MVDDILEEVLTLDALADQPALHVCERRDDRVDRAGVDLLPQLLERQHPADAARPARPRRRPVAALGCDVRRIGGWRFHDARRSSLSAEIVSTFTSVQRPAWA